MRLIDADAIKYKYMLNHGGFAIAAEQKEINRMPTVDAVPVIRCKDCKYYFKSDEKCQLIDTRLHFYETNKRWAEDSFCSWAERRNDETD